MEHGTWYFIIVQQKLDQNCTRNLQTSLGPIKRAIDWNKWYSETKKKKMKIIILTDSVPIDDNLHSGDKNHLYLQRLVINELHCYIHSRIMNGARWILVPMFLFHFFCSFFFKMKFSKQNNLFPSFWMGLCMSWNNERKLWIVLWLSHLSTVELSKPHIFALLQSSEWND